MGCRQIDIGQGSLRLADVSVHRLDCVHRDSLAFRLNIAQLAGLDDLLQGRLGLGDELLSQRLASRSKFSGSMVSAISVSIRASARPNRCSSRAASLPIFQEPCLSLCLKRLYGERAHTNTCLPIRSFNAWGRSDWEQSTKVALSRVAVEVQIGPKSSAPL